MKLSFVGIFFVLVPVFSFSGCKQNETQSTLAAIESSTEIVNGNYIIKSIHSGLCLDVPDSSTLNNVMLQQYSCNGSNAQIWTVYRIDARFMTITNVTSGKSLDITNASKEDGARVVQFTLDNKQKNQQFSIDGRSGQMAIRSRHSGKVLEIVGNSKDNKAQIQQSSDSKSPHQRWSFLPVNQP